MAIGRAVESLCSWTIVALLTALPLSGCASGTGPGDSSSGLAGGPGASAGGSTPAKKLKPKGKKGSLGKKGGALGGGTGGGGTGGGGKTGGGKKGGGKKGGGKMGYAFVERPGEEHRQGVSLEAGQFETFAFEWHDASGLAPAADLSVEAEDHPIIQVSALGGTPFARAGVDVVPLKAGTQYTLVIERDSDELTISIVNEVDDVLIESHAHAALDDEETAAVVLPSTEYRQSIVSNDL